MPFGDLSTLTLLPKVKHVFSHRVWHVQLVPLMMKIDQAGLQENENMRWQSPKQIRDLPVSTLQQKLLKALESYL